MMQSVWQAHFEILHRRLLLVPRFRVISRIALSRLKEKPPGQLGSGAHSRTALCDRSTVNGRRNLTTEWQRIVHPTGRLQREARLSRFSVSQDCSPAGNALVITLGSKG